MSLSSFPAKEMEEVIPNWLELPRDITANILQRLCTVDIVTAACLVCPLWWNICKDPFMWRTIHMTKLNKSRSDLLKICRYAIERSYGHLEDININRFGTNNLLKNIAENGSHLRRLRLIDCSEISDKGLIEAAMQLPLLEELDIQCSYFTKDSLEVIGQSCPLLKSLKYSNGYNGDYKWYDEPLSFFKSMPELRHLEICGYLVDNDGLLAILDGCPLLESLVFQEGDYIEYERNIFKRLYEQIKKIAVTDRYRDDSFRDDDTYLNSLSENSNDHSNLDYDDDYDLDDSDLGAISGDEN